MANERTTAPYWSWNKPEQERRCAALRAESALKFGLPSSDPTVGKTLREKIMTAEVPVSAVTPLRSQCREQIMTAEGTTGQAADSPIKPEEKPPGKRSLGESDQSGQDTVELKLRRTGTTVVIGENDRVRMYAHVLAHKLAKGAGATEADNGKERGSGDVEAPGDAQGACHSGERHSPQESQEAETQQQDPTPQAPTNVGDFSRSYTW